MAEGPTQAPEVRVEARAAEHALLLRRHFAPSFARCVIADAEMEILYDDMLRTCLVLNRSLHPRALLYAYRCPALSARLVS